MPKVADIPEAEKKQVGKRWRRIRVSQLFLTQPELAEKIGLHKDTIGNIEKGKSYPSRETIKKMSELTGRTQLELVSTFNEEDVKVLSHQTKIDIFARALGNEIKNMLEAQSSSELKEKIYGSNRFDVLLAPLMEGFDSTEVDDFSKAIATAMAKAVFDKIEFPTEDEGENES